MATVAQALSLAVRHHHAGRLDLADDIYGRILAVDAVDKRGEEKVLGELMRKELADKRAALKKDTLAAVETYKDVPGVLMWILGNESNYGLEWTSNEIENLPGLIDEILRHLPEAQVLVVDDNSPDGTGAMLGINPRTFTGSHYARSVMEGVTLGMNYGLRRLAELGVKPSQIRATGGGAKSRIWRQIMADIFNAEVVTLEQNYRCTAPILDATNAIIAHPMGILQGVDHLFTGKVERVVIGYDLDLTPAGDDLDSTLIARIILPALHRAGLAGREDLLVRN